jgi:hypothetical protein
MKWFLVVGSFSIRQSKKLSFVFGINVDSEIVCVSIAAGIVSSNIFQLI